MLSVVLSCCNLLPDKNQKSKIRVVDIDGNPKEIKRYVPQLNAEALAKQGYKVNVETGELEPTNSTMANQKTAETNVPVTNINNNLASTDLNPTVGLLQNSPSGAEQSQMKNNGQTIIFQNNKNKVAEQKSNKENSAVEYDLSGTGPVIESKAVEPIVGKIQEEKPKKKFNILIEKAADSKPANKAESKANKSSSSSSRGLFIQIGSFASSEIANKILTKNHAIHSGKIEEAKINNKKTYRVLLGPIKDQNEADKILNKVVNAGHGDAFVTKNK